MGEKLVPRWSPRLPKEKLIRFYHMDSKGILDEALIDDVGVSLLLRCQSFIDAVRAANGKAKCPTCSSYVEHDCGKETILRCPCGWELPWREYFETIQGKQLSGAGYIVDRFETYVRAFSGARTAREKILAIDTVIHEFHYYAKGDAFTRPAAINLIEGRLPEIVDLLDRISEGCTDADCLRTYRTWDERIRKILPDPAIREKGKAARP